MPLLQRKKPDADLTRSYPVQVQFSIILTLIALIVLFRVNLDPDTDIDFEEQEQEIVEMEDIIQTQQDETPPPPPRPQTPEPVPDDEIVEDAFFDFDIDQNASADLPPPPPQEDEEEEDEVRIFEVVEDEPYPIGGLDVIYENLEYPEIARRAGIEGIVVIQFVVDQTGQVSDFNIIRDIGGGAGDAAINAIRQTQWEPGRQRGRAVPVRFQIPIRFVLQN